MRSDGSLRVLQITPRFYPSVGGIETHVREVARRLPAHGIASEVLTADETARLAADEVVDGVHVHRVHAYPRHRDWMFAPSLPEAIGSSHWDVIHVQSYHTLLVPAAMMIASYKRI